MSDLFTPLGNWTLVDGYISALIRGRGRNCMTRTSANAMVNGEGFIRAFNGVNLLAGKVGSRVFFNTDNSYAGLGTVATNGVGSVFNVRKLLMYIGTGQVNFDGDALAGIIASSTLSLIKKTGASYVAGPTTGPFQAGHAQPSAPTIFAKAAPSPGKAPMNGAVTVVCWRVSSITGQVSLMSLPSNSLTLTAQSVIVQLPLSDTNGQDIFAIGVVKIGFDDLGVYYALPISLGGEVTEATLAFTRAAGNVTFTATSDTAEVTGGVTSVDVGRRLTDGTFSTWITAIVDGTHVKINDIPVVTTTAAATITHAVDGITRAVEISWTNGALAQQEIAPDKAFPPVAGQFAGSMNDVLFLDADGIIYVSEPGYIGSFAPKSAIFAPEPAVLYLRFSKGLVVRFGKNTMGTLYYVGGSPALEYQTIWEHMGIAFPQNAALGANGRLLAWLGRPTVMQADEEPDIHYADDVLPDFAGWDAGQTAAAPICVNYDARGDYEVWAWKKKVMAKLVSSGKWCAPIDLTGKIPGDIQSLLAFNHRLYLSVVNAGVLSLYEFDAGTGSVMIVQTDDVRRGTDNSINLITGQVRCDIDSPVKVEVIVNQNDAAPVVVTTDARVTPTVLGSQELDPTLMRPNILNVKSLALRVTMTSGGGDCGPDMFEVAGSTSEVITP